jgi:cytochrome c oxidase subunit 2
VKNKAFAVLASTACLLFASNALADKPVAWQTNFQTGSDRDHGRITWFEHYTLWFIVPITLFVLGLLIWIVFRFRASANPVPSKTSHNTLIEIVWTLVR